MNTGQVRRPEKLESWEKNLKIKDVINGVPKLVGTQFYQYFFIRGFNVKSISCAKEIFPEIQGRDMNN